MWIFGKIKASVESIPLEINRYMVKSEEDIFDLSKTGPTQNLPGNIITPENIPEFCLPPRLCKRTSLSNADLSPRFTNLDDHLLNTVSSLNAAKDGKRREGDASAPGRGAKKPLPFSAETYGLAGIYESPNTRRKESLFHTKSPVYMLERSISASTPVMLREVTSSKRTLYGLLPLFSSKTVSGAGGTGSETPSTDSSPLLSPCAGNSSFRVPAKKGDLKVTKSCPALMNRVDSKRSKISLVQSSLVTEKNSFTLAPPVICPLEVLHCQERLQSERVFPLQGRGQIRLSAENNASTSIPFSALFVVRVRVISVEGLRDKKDQLALNCAVSLCLTPGKQQQQTSAIIKNCRNPVFNEDFFFTELSQSDLLKLNLKLKVVDKSAGKLRRETVIGVTDLPLSQLLDLTTK